MALLSNDATKTIASDSPANAVHGQHAGDLPMKSPELELAELSSLVVFRRCNWFLLFTLYHCPLRQSKAVKYYLQS